MNKTQQLIQGILTGNRLALARAISQVENEAETAPALLAALFPHTGRAHIIGVTGAPGTGKSTLVTTLAKSYRTAGLTVGIVAVDPTSPFTGGALLGDRVRMHALSGDAGVFVRSMATRGALGGLSKTTDGVVTLLDAAGFERILVETVGVGQAEVEVAALAHTTLVVEAPGLGDEVQAIKAGILEIADLLVVNKADLAGVEKTVKALEMMLELGKGATYQVRHHGQWLPVAQPESTQPVAGWPVAVLKTVAASGEGVTALRDQIEAHRTWLESSGERAQRDRARLAHTVEAIVRGELTRHLLAKLPAGDLSDLVERIRQRTTDPYTVAIELAKSVLLGTSYIGR